MNHDDDGNKIDEGDNDVEDGNDEDHMEEQCKTCIEILCWEDLLESK